MKKLLFIYFLSFAFIISAQSTIDSLENLIATTDNDSLKMEWYNKLRRTVIYQDLAAARIYAQKYLDYAQQLDLPTQTALAKVYLGNVIVQQDEFEPALALFLEALPHFQKIKDYRRLGGTYNSIAAAYEHLGRDSLTQIYFQKSYEIGMESGNYYSASIALNNLSNVAFRAEDYVEAERLIRAAITELKKDSIRVEQFLPIYNVTLANALAHAKRYQEADQLLKNVIEQTDGQNNYYLTYAHAFLGYSQLKQGRAKTAVRSLETAERLMNDYKVWGLRSDLYSDLSEAYALQGDYQKAYIKLNDYQNLRDSVFTEEKAQALNNALQKYETDKKNQQIELLSSQNELKDLKILRNQRERWALVGGLLSLGLIAGLVYRNNRLRKRANVELERKNFIINKALDEKNLLLKEIHHRVKNNLQVISSLLRLQSRYIDDETALEAIQESQNRVRSMSLLHQNLYQDDRLTDVEVQTYFNQLLDELFQSYQINQQQIKIVKNIAPLQLDVDTVIPLGLIVNELITNALKYAFVETEQGVIQVDLQQNQAGLRLQVRDDGVGVDPEVFRNSRSFGNRMIRAFAAKLEGEFNIKNEAGTVFEMQLPFSNKGVGK